MWGGQPPLGDQLGKAYGVPMVGPGKSWFLTRSLSFQTCINSRSQHHSQDLERFQVSRDIPRVRPSRIPPCSLAAVLPFLQCWRLESSAYALSIPAFSLISEIHPRLNQQSVPFTAESLTSVPSYGHSSLLALSLWKDMAVAPGL